MKTKWLLLGVAGLFAGIQGFPIDRTLPATRENEEFHVLETPPGEIMRLLKHACYDCHSNNTRYPWYSYLQPVGWWIQHHIREGRRELNFSEFGRWDAGERAEVLDHCARMIEKGAMPLTSYQWIHAGARLSETQKDTLMEWLRSRAGYLQTGAVVAPVGRHEILPRDTCDDPDANPRCCFAGMPGAPGYRVAVAPDGEPGKRMLISGRILKKDGKTPYAGVLMYVYHTNHEGIYAPKGGETGIRRWHGHLHGWLRTDEQGRYEIRSIRPAPYPRGKGPAHIHAVVWEPGGQKEPYYIDDFLFADDPNVKSADLEHARKNPGKSPVLTLRTNQEGILEGKRDIRL